jgi:hypothetical protein
MPINCFFLQEVLIYFIAVCMEPLCAKFYTSRRFSVGNCTVGGGAWVRASAIYREAGYHTHRCAVPLSHFHSGSGDFFEISI